MVVQLFVLEISNDRIRGALGSMLMLSYNFGVLFSFILGHYCTYFTIPKVVVALTALYASLFVLFPESPIQLLKRNKISVSKNYIDAEFDQFSL